MPSVSPRCSPPWSTVVFDLDGTLVDTIGLIVASYQHAAREVLGHELDERRVLAFIGRPLIECWREVDAERADALFDSYTAWNEAHPHLIRPYAGADDLLQGLHAAGAGVAVATSKRRDPALLALDRCGLADLIPVLVTMEDTPVHKPDPAPLLLALGRAGGSVERSAYVGDAAVDMLAARAADMQGIGVLWGAGERAAIEAADPYAVAPTMTDLHTLLLPTD